MGITKHRLPELHAWMKKTKTTQAALARLLGCSQAMISRYLSGGPNGRHLSVDDALTLALLTDIPVEKLLTGGDAAKILKLLRKPKAARPHNPKDLPNVV